LSPNTPVSLHDANVGDDGTDGATVSTENANELNVCACGCVSRPVNTCDPSANRDDVRTHTFAYMSAPNDPTNTPSIDTSYFDKPPSPMIQNDGVADNDAVRSDPVCKF
jgi:hypothetical protein